MTTPPPVVPVAGLLVPAPLVPRIVAAFRGTYPSVTEGLNSEAAVRAVLRHLVTVILANYEATAAEAPVKTALETVEEDYRERGRQARERALLDAQKITEAPPTAPPA